MKLQSIRGLVIAIIFVVTSSAYAQQTAGVLLQSGLYKEDVNGDLEAAIAIYERVLKDFPQDRAYAAKALLHMGLCYEKLGRDEARKAYERVVREFADQSEPVSAARARLTDLGRQKGEEGPILRRVYSGNLGYPFNLSHDGKLAAIADWDTGDGNLAVRDLTSGQVRRVTKSSGSEPNGRTEGSIFSPDDKQIAYVWYMPGEDGRGPDQTQLRIISADGTGQRILYPRNEENKKNEAYLWPIDWSPDGERILCTLSKKDDKKRVMLLSVGDSSLRELELPEREKLELMDEISWAKFSPDGRHLTLEGRPAKDAGRRDIFLLSLEDGSRTALVEDPADDRLLGWSPDGNYLVFASDRTGDPSIWVLRVDQGKPVGNPLLVKTQMGDFYRVGMTRDGAFLYGTGSGARLNIFTASFDPQTGKVTTAPKALLPDGEFHRTNADWLPGADEIVYEEFGSKNGRTIKKIMIHSLKTGSTREVVTQPQIQHSRTPSLAVCPTGRWLAVLGSIIDDGPWRVLLIDIETNELTEVSQWGSFAFIHWSKDGRQLYFSGYPHQEGDRKAFFRRDMQTGKVTELFKPPWSFSGWKISPNGKQIAYADVDWENDEIKVMVIPVTGGEPRVVVKMKAVESGDLEFWTPDGRYLVYTDREQLWRVAVEGGEPEAVSPKMAHDVAHLRIHPDGQSIHFSGRLQPYKKELWALENFLPESTAGN